MYFFRVVLIFVLLFDETHAGDVILAVLGNTVLLECKIPQTDTMIWDRPDGTVIAIKGIIQPGINETKFVLQSSSKLQSLSIHELELPDDGVYRCYDLAHAGTKQEFTVNIFVRPTYFRVRGPDTGVDEGSEYEFRCEVDGGKPSPFIRWHISGPNTNGSSFSGINQDTLHSNGTIFRRNILRLRVTREMYQASVICDSSIEYFYQVQQTTVLNVSLFPLEPSFDIFTGLYDDGKVTTITCRSKGSRPAANIYWILNGRRVNITSNEVKRLADGTFDVTGTLVKKLTKAMENQTLSCAVTNPVLVRSLKPHLLKTVILLPNYAPSIVGDNGTRIVEERISLSLTCIIRSRPLPKTGDPLWFHNDAPISTGQYYNITRIDLSLSQLVTTLAILHIKKDLSGRYNCQAFNHLGSARGLPMNIEVLYRPVCLFSGVHKYAVRLGSSIKLTCPVVANPNNVTMSWRYVQRNLPIKSSLIGDVDSQTRSSTSILIDVVSDRQYSDVACVATNRLGDMMIPCLYRLVEPSPPEIPSNCSSTTISDSELRVECSPGFNGGSPQHFLLQLKDVTNFRTVMNQSLPVFIKRDLIPNTNYTFRICAATSAFTKTISCASPLSASTFIGAVGQKRVTTEVESASITPYIIGGVVGFIFLVVLISVIACFLHKKRKVGKESEEVLDTPKHSQNNTPSMPSITDCFTHAQFQSVVNFPKNVENDVFHRQSDPADPSLVRVAKINTTTDASKKSQYEYQVVGYF